MKLSFALAATVAATLAGLPASAAPTAANPVGALVRGDLPTDYVQYPRFGPRGYAYRGYGHRRGPGVCAAVGAGVAGLAAGAIIGGAIANSQARAAPVVVQGGPEADDAAVMAAARAAARDGFVRGLADGYNTIVGERGARLSGGQRQRIGIARAILKRAPILLLDEATSALDTETEMAIQAALVRIMRDRTVIAVAHRLSTLTAFDRILVVEGGRIVEDGTIRRLREANGLFEEMWRLQAKGLSDAAVMDAA